MPKSCPSHAQVVMPESPFSNGTDSPMDYPNMSSINPPSRHHSRTLSKWIITILYPSYNPSFLWNMYIWARSPDPHTPPQWYPPPTPNPPTPPKPSVCMLFAHIHTHIHIYTPLSTLQPRISTLFAALESHDHPPTPPKPSICTLFAHIHTHIHIYTPLSTPPTSHLYVICSTWEPRPRQRTLSTCIFLS